MTQADFDYTDFDKSKQATLDETLLVKFFIKQRPDPSRTLAEQRPIFKDVEYIDIKIPGSNTGGACRPARQDDVERFPRHYAAFKQRVAQPEEGTPLSEWPLITRSMAEELAFFNVKTVEQLAGMADVQASKFMGINKFRQQATEWLEVAKEQAGSKELQTELEKRDKEIAKLQAQIDQLGSPKDAEPEEVVASPKKAVPRETVAAKPKTRRRRKKAAVE